VLSTVQLARCEAAMRSVYIVRASLNTKYAPDYFGPEFDIVIAFDIKGKAENFISKQSEEAKEVLSFEVREVSLW
jgi:hypothetical protein